MDLGRRAGVRSQAPREALTAQYINNQEMAAGGAVCAWCVNSQGRLLTRPSQRTCCTPPGSLRMSREGDSGEDQLSAKKIGKQHLFQLVFIKKVEYQHLGNKNEQVEGSGRGGRSHE